MNSFLNHINYIPVWNPTNKKIAKFSEWLLNETDIKNDCAHFFELFNDRVTYC